MLTLKLTKLQSGKPWWDTDWPDAPPIRYHSAWATLPPRAPSSEVGELLEELRKLCPHGNHTRGCPEGGCPDPAAERDLRRAHGVPCAAATAIGEELAVLLARERGEVRVMLWTPL